MGTRDGEVHRGTVRVGEHDVVEVEQLGLLAGDDGGVGGTECSVGKARA
jgi:hypothetical protein